LRAAIGSLLFLVVVPGDGEQYEAYRRAVPGGWLAGARCSTSERGVRLT
jgi:hypothetical protein